MVAKEGLTQITVSSPINQANDCWLENQLGLFIEDYFPPLCFGFSTVTQACGERDNTT